MRLLPDPDRPYRALRNDLVAMGWVWANESQTLPVLPGEPEWVRYRHAGGGELTYAFNPAVGLREIKADGPADLLAALATLPQLSAAGLARLLDDDEIGSILRGILGVRALQWLPLLPRVRDLREHPDELVRRAATDVAAGLPEAAVTEALGRFHAMRQAHPDRSALLTLMPAADRRQVLRWLGKDRRDANEHVLAALRTGLTDPDAEVRVTAALVAARLRAGALGPAVENISVPPVFAGALAHALGALRSGTGLHLEQPVDDESLLVQSLVEPLPMIPPPRELPRHLREVDGSVRLARSGLVLSLVPAVPHWFGSSGAPANPLRRNTIRPFAITSLPVDGRTAQLLQMPIDGPDLHLTADDALEMARRVGLLEDVPVHLPTAEQWEAALRGPDGRRFSAGNERAEPAVSPWRAFALPGPEWVDGGLLRDSADLVLASSADPHGRWPARLALAFPI